MVRVILCFLFLPVFTFAQSYSYWLAGSEEDVNTAHAGGILLAGGGGDNDDAMSWMLEQAAGGDIVVIRASGSDGYNDYLFSDLGINVNSVETIRFDEPEAAYDDFVIQTIRNAEALFIAGGDQYDYYQFWKDTPIQDAINYLINTKNITVGGTSAGMAILGQAYYTPSDLGVTAEEALSDPFHPYLDTLGYNDFVQNAFLTNTITDTHYDQRDRKGRHVVFLARMAAATNQQFYGIACNEYTAVCITATGQTIVYGEYPEYDDFAYFLQTNCQPEPLPETMQPGESLHWVRGQSAVKAYKVGGTIEGTSPFNITDWSEATGGVWENWYIDNGNLEIISDTNGNCADVITSTQAPTGESLILLSQNPVRDELQLLGNTQIEHLQILNVHGVRVYSGGQHKLLDVSHLPKGIYFLQVLVKNGWQQVSFVKS